MNTFTQTNHSDKNCMLDAQNIYKLQTILSNKVGVSPCNWRAFRCVCLINAKVDAIFKKNQNRKLNLTPEDRLCIHFSFCRKDKMKKVYIKSITKRERESYKRKPQTSFTNFYTALQAAESCFSFRKITTKLNINYFWVLQKG